MVAKGQDYSFLQRLVPWTDEESSSTTFHRATDAGTSRLPGTPVAANGGMRMGMARADNAEPELEGDENSDAGRKVDAVSELLWIASPDPEFLAAAGDLEACRDPWRRVRRLAFRARGNSRWCGMNWVYEDEDDKDDYDSR
ncbi:hypothetical protein K438DRAFT_1779077 [Mycena galopus ATCC 62051]|nr:hypothetical protein K438DRAFT_1779077 [Mycena galopus ATCC 62051]